MAGPTAFPASAIISGVISRDRLPPGLGVPFVSVLDHGATGDGETDDTTAIQAAIDSAEGKLIFVPKGEYILSQNASTGYCLRIMHSVSILMEPGSVLKLATTVPNTVNAIQIGDGSTAVSGVSIEGGTIDGDAVANGGSYSIATALIYASGPVQRVTIRNMVLRNALGSGLVIDGQSSESRAKHITVEDCIITEVAEGVRFQKCDEFHMRGGSITKMMAQDGFEPHGALHGWSLRDCYIAEPHPTNSAIEIYPQYGDIQGGLIENCTIVSDELRISLSSGAGATDYEVRDVTVRNCYFNRSNVYGGVGGKFKNVTFEGNRFEGPCEVRRSTSAPFAGIKLLGTTNTSRIINNRISGYQSHGISTQCSRDVLIGNEIFNNGTDTSQPSSNRRGVLLQNGGSAIGNNVYDDQESPTQAYGITGSTLTIGNTSTGHPVGDWLTTAGVHIANIGANGLDQYKKRARVKVLAGNDRVIIDQALTGLSLNSQKSAIVCQVGDGSASASPMAPATNAWLGRSGSTLRLYTNAAVAADTEFLIVVDNSVPTIIQP